MSGPLHLRIFLSSPGDVAEERAAARTLLTELPRRPWARGRVTIETIAWDDELASTPLDATELPQLSVNRYNTPPSQCDLTVVLLWGRLGTPLASHMPKPDGTRYASGTEWELEDARAAKKPVWLYRRAVAPTISLDDPDEDQKREQYKRVRGFLAKLKDADGALLGAANDYDSVAKLRELLTQHLEAEVRRRLELHEGKAAAAAEPAPERFRIFLATAADDQRALRLKLARQLSALPTVELFAETPPPEEREPHTSAVEECVRKADLCVHLLGAGAGADVEWADNQPGATYVSEQLRIGLSSARTQLILQPSDFDLQRVSQPEYAKLLGEVMARPDPRSRLEIVRAGRPEVFDIIRGKQREIEEARLRAQDAALGTAGNALLEVHARDYGRSQPLVAYMQRRRIAPLSVPPPPASQDAALGAGMHLDTGALQDFAQRVRESAFLIVVFGEVARDWVDGRLQEALKLIASENLPTRLGVYVTDPQKRTEQVRFPGFYRVLDHTSGFDQPSLDRWLEQLAAA
jgi:hypothetical protein